MTMEVLGFDNIDKVRSSQLFKTSQKEAPQILYALSTVAFLVLVIAIYIIHQKCQENEELGESNAMLLAENMRLGKMLNAKDAQKK
jgi:hypothetical protein